jgi:flavonoid 3'-monooxygenase
LNCASEMIQVLSNFNVNELIPILKPFDLQGLERRMKRIANQVESYHLNILK